MTGENELKFLKPELRNKDARTYANRVEGLDKAFPDNSLNDGRYQGFLKTAKKIESEIYASKLHPYPHERVIDYLKAVRDRKRISHLKIQGQERVKQAEERKSREADLEERVKTEKATIDSVLAKAEKELSKNDPYLKDISSFLEVARVKLKQSHLSQGDRKEYGSRLDKASDNYHTRLQARIKNREDKEFDDYNFQITNILAYLESTHESTAPINLQEIKKQMQEIDYGLLKSKMGESRRKGLEEKLQVAREKVESIVKREEEEKKKIELEEEKKRQEGLNKSYQLYNGKISAIYRGFNDAGAYNVREEIISLRRELKSVDLKIEDREKLSKNLDELWGKASLKINGSDNKKDAPKKLLDRLTRLNADRINRLIPDTKEAIKNSTNPTYQREKQAFLEELEGQVKQTKNKIKELEKELGSP